MQVPHAGMILSGQLPRQAFNRLLVNQLAVVVLDVLGQVDVGGGVLALRVGKLGAQHWDLTTTLNGEGHIPGTAGEAVSTPVESAWLNSQRSQNIIRRILWKPVVMDRTYPRCFPGTHPDPVWIRAPRPPHP